VLAGLLVGGFVCNLLVRPVAAKWFMTEEELAAERRLAHEKAQAATAEIKGATVVATPSSPAVVALLWLFVGIPLAWGVYVTLQKAFVLFH
jgi:hypothetical protein